MDVAFLEAPDLSGLAADWENLADGRKALVAKLAANGQRHLFADWDPPGTADAEKAAFLDALDKVDAAYPGGLLGYADRARTLLAGAREGKNPFEGCVPEKPDVVDLARFGADYDRYEALGVRQFEKTGIVLVAGGLGERLGYNGIKLDIAVETLESTTYLAHYAACILAMQARMANPRPVPFIVMVSQDTAAKTAQSLEANGYFGLEPGQVHLLRQELVPAIADNEGSLALEGKYKLVLKPHGHGDIHLLLHSSGLAARLAGEGFEHLAFIQDTNAQVFNILPAALGVSVDKGYDFNSHAVNRVPGEAVGGIARLVGNGRELTLNVEYNLLDPLLRATISPAGDVPDASGFSIFPGNCNTLVVRLDSYVRILEASRGVIAEFVNPKYTDATKTAFKKPTRLETLMQDLPRFYAAGEKVGVSVFDRAWSFSPNKNNLADAAAKVAAGGPADAAATAESDFYAAGRARLQAAGAAVETAAETRILGIPFTPGPKVVLRPSFAMTLAEGREKIGGCSIAGEASLVLDGAGIRLEDVRLAGTSALVVKACEGAKVTVRGRFENGGFELARLPEEERSPGGDAPEYLKIRGYRFENRAAAVYRFDQPGEYVVRQEG